MNKNFSFLFLVCSMQFACQAASDRTSAFCAVPVADMVGQPITSLYPEQSAKESYQNIALSGETGKNPCPRIQQLLAHEQVTIIDEQGPEVLVELPHLFYIAPQNPEPNNRFWTLREYLTTFSELKAHGLDPYYLPQPFSWKHSQDKRALENTVTLILPFYDYITGQLYSAGTRFVIAFREYGHIGVYVFDPRSFTFQQTSIPRCRCHIHETKSKIEYIADFVSLLKLWANYADGFIPFVWGGNSLRDFCTDYRFYEKSQTKSNGERISVWVRPGYSKKPYSGFDSSSLVLRAAQLCGIPYFFKNSTTARAFLRPLKDGERVNQGDIMWMPQGLAVISDLKRNKIIMARGYQTTYGRVVELSLSAVFKNIYTYKDLMDAYSNKTPLESLDNQGNSLATIKEFSILSMASAWQARYPSW